MVGLRQNARLAKGALVQINEQTGFPIPNIIPFQYNPATVSRSFQLAKPDPADDTGRGLTAPTAQPFDPEESFSLTLELDATDELAEEKPLAVAFGVSARIASIEGLVYAGEGPLGEAAAAVAAAIGLNTPRRTVPIVFFVFGPGRIIPVRIQTLTIEEELFDPNLFPIQAKVNISMRMLRPSEFQCQVTPPAFPPVSSVLAMAAYTVYRTERQALAIANVSNVVDAIRGLLPI